MNHPLYHPAIQRDMQIALMSLRTTLSVVALSDGTRAHVNHLIDVLEKLVNMQQIEGVMEYIDNLVQILDEVQISPNVFVSVAMRLANLKYMANL